MKNDFLSNGAEKLEELKDYYNKTKQTEAEVENVGRNLEQIEKEIKDRKDNYRNEIEAILKEKRKEILGESDAKLAELNDKCTILCEKFDKEKGLNVTKRIIAETEDLQVQNDKIDAETIAKIKSAKIPKMCTTTLFSSLFMPVIGKEGAIMALVLFIILGPIPIGIYFGLIYPYFYDGSHFMLSMVYLIDAVFFGGIYLVVNNAVKERYFQPLKELGELRKRKHFNNIKIKRNSKLVIKNPDECFYGLEDLQKEIRDVQNEIVKVLDVRKEEEEKYELKVEVQTKEEVRIRYEADLEELRAKKTELEEEKRRITTEYRFMEHVLQKEYGQFLGKENMNRETIDRLIEFIKLGEAKTIGDAITINDSKNLDRDPKMPDIKIVKIDSEK